MAYDVVIFDLDGTLLDTLDDLMDSCNYALSTIGAPPRTRAEIRRFVGNGIRNLMLQAVPDGADNPKFEQAYETMQTWYKAHNQIKTAPYPGVQRLIRTLKQQGVPMAVVSNKPDASVQMLVEQWFPEITFGLGEREGLRRKPERDMVDYAITQLGQTGKKTVYVGDSEVDLTTAANAGLDCISVTWGFRDRALLVERGAKQFADTAEELLRQVWVNLLDNAVKFSPDGGTVELSAREENGAVTVRVANTGSEIAPDKLEHIWNKFYQADESHAAQGNGLGLSIVRSVVELHGGSVSAASRDDYTVFTVTLPAPETAV